ncbi:MAG: LysR family transcriptional regulator [Planctomycetota bacterium]|nr:MAG: LysR family transcriptional regulator [Planctomycetota bacterium]
MNIETFRIFCDLVNLKNLSRTAEKHGISQSAVSQQLAQLEMAHRCQLVDRKKRPLKLTAPGQLFYQAAKDILERYNRLSSELATLGKTTARINVAAIFSIGMHTLQPHVKTFMAKYPKVNLNIEYASAEEIYERVLRGDIDIGVVAVPRKDRNIDVHPLEEEPLVLVCGPDNPLAGSQATDIHELQGVPFIAFEKGVPSRALIDDILKQYDVTVRMMMEFDNIETIKRAVEIDAGVSILPETTIHAELANSTLKAIPFSNEKFARPAGLIIRKNKTLTRAAKFLIELLQKKA